jgi:NAD(P)-dependent dehydrogenase (short-subunit alcohol dehydrogenase family)
VTNAVPVRYISRPALSNFQTAESNLILFAGCGNNDATVSSPSEFILNSEIAPAYVYFASEIDSSYVSGEVLTLLGGETTAG